MLVYSLPAALTLPLKRQIKIAADGILIFYFYLSKKIWPDFSCESCLTEDSLETSSLIFLGKNNEKIFMNALCYSRDWLFLRINATETYSNIGLMSTNRQKYRCPAGKLTQHIRTTATAEFTGPTRMTRKKVITVVVFPFS